MAEFSDFELSGDRQALPPSATPSTEPEPQRERAAAPEPPAGRGRLSSLAAPAVILVATVAVLSARPPEPTWTASGPSSKSVQELPTTYPLVVRVAPAEAVPTPVIETSPSAVGTTTEAEPPLKLLSAKDAHPPEAAVAPATAAVSAPAAGEAVRPEENLAPVAAPAPVAAAPAPKPPAPAPFTVAVPHDPIQTRLAVASIAAEARRKAAEAAQVAAMQGAIQEIEQHRVAEQMHSERESADRRRTEFRQELAAILQRDGDRSAPEIWRLVQSRHVEPSPIAERAIAEAIRARRGRLGRIDRVEIFREHGLDESLIFAELYREQVEMIPRRGGPRTREEAVVRAARALLAIDLEPLTAARAAARP